MAYPAQRWLVPQTYTYPGFPGSQQLSCQSGNLPVTNTPLPTGSKEGHSTEAPQAYTYPGFPGTQQVSGNLPATNTLLPTGSKEGHSTKASYSYFVRLINPKNKSDFVVRMCHDITGMIQSPTALKLKLMDSFPSDIPSTTDFQIGYFEPPSNTKRWIVDERDMKMMYSCYERGAKVNLWCEAKVKEAVPEKKHANDENEPPPSAKRKKATPREQLEEDTDVIFQDLKEKHPKMEAPKLRLWAKLIQSGRHESYDTPPQIPLIIGAPAPAKPKKDSVADALTGAATAIVQALQPPKAHDSPVVRKCSESDVNKISPLKMTTIRRNCLDDLKKLKELLEDGVLEESVYRREAANPCHS